MRTELKLVLVILSLALVGGAGLAYECLQGPTELIYWDKAQTYNGYTLFGAQGTTYLIDMEGRVVHTWPVGSSPRLLDNGHLLDATNATVLELDWNGSNVWSYTESRTNYFPHNDFIRITNPKLGTNTTLYIANKAIPSNQCIAAGCNPANGAYTNVTVDSIVEVDMSGNVVWEWCFFDHGIQNYDVGKSNYLASTTNAPGKLNLNLPGRPVTNDWLHCTSLDYNSNLDQVVITAEGGEFYVIDHGNTFVSNNPAASIVLAASANGDFLYRFGDPARYGQGNPPSIQQNWSVSTTGNKQIGGVSQVQWIPTGVPGAGHFLVFNNGQDLFETTPQSYIFEVNGFLNSSTNDTGAYVNPPAAGYNTWSPPGHDTDKQKKSMSKQIVSMFYSMANQAFFSPIGGSAQWLPNGNLLICSAAEGHLIEVTSSGEAVWEYVNPVTSDGPIAYKRDNWPLYNAVYRATRYSSAHPALAGRSLTGINTIMGIAPSYISTPTITNITLSPTSPTSVDPVTVTAQVLDGAGLASVSLTYSTGSGAAMTNTAFLETMATNGVKPWAGGGCNNAWVVTGSNSFEQSTNWNYGAGNPCGMQFKQGTGNLTNSMIAAATGIAATGSSASVEFYLWAGGLSTNTGWNFQLNAGAGYVTRLGELGGTNHSWQLYHYDLLPGERVTNLMMRFQFAGGSTSNRINLDQISIKALTAGSSSATIPMSLVSNGLYTAQIPAQAEGATVTYSITATDTFDFSATVGASNDLSYVVGGVTTNISTSFTSQFVRIPSGSYVMGDHFEYIDLKHYTDEIPLHTVYISPMYMATTLNTLGEYCAYLNSALGQGLIEVRSNIVYAVGGTNVYFYTHAASSSSHIQWTGSTFVVLNNRGLRPATSVRWFGAIAYCNWLSQQGSFDPCYNLDTGDVDFSKNGYRLPTEAEWEYAAHGGLTNPYCMFPWGTNSNPDGTYANWENSGDPFETTNAYPCTTPVGFYNGALRYKSDYNWPGSQSTYQTCDGSNPYGLYDMAGNVWEWCNDWYQNTYYTNCVINNIVTNPPGPTLANADLFPSSTNGEPYRCLRGGTWWNGNSTNDFDYGHARVSNRDPSYFLGGGPPGDPYSEWSQTGFRVMRPEKLTQTVGLFLNTTNACPGYTLMSPMQGNNTYLLNNDGQYVHMWTSQFNPGRGDYLTAEGHLMRTCSVGLQSKINTGGGEGGRLEEHDWLGNLIWVYELNTPTNMTHHDIALLPNGNVLMIACEKKYLADVLAAGFKTNAQTDISIRTNGGFMLPDYIIEVRPDAKDGTTNGTVIWEWHAWDHLIQDYDSGKSNFGVVSNHVELINANAGNLQQFWNHFNGIDYNPQFDQILISSRNQCEVWIIDHSTTTAQAAGHTGGRCGKGGDLLYRWGFPGGNNLADSNHKQMLWQQHCATWIPTNCPGAGHILIHDNGVGRGYTSIDEIVPPVDSNGFYSGSSNVYFGPTNYYWVYTNNPATNFYGTDIGGAEREPNGNTLITWGVFGTLFEVTSNGQTVWSYVNPVTHDVLAQGSVIPNDPNNTAQHLNEVFKVHRYQASYSGLACKDLTPRGTIETYAGAATDTIGLGLPDKWVRSHFGSLSVVTTNSSHSGNGLTDIQEYKYGLDPTQWSSCSNGIPDGWAIAYGFDPTLAGLAGLMNVNGFTLLQSYAADLNPTNPASRLAMLNLTLVTNGVQLTWIGGSGAWQYLECSSNLAANAWQAVYTNFPPTSITNRMIDVGLTPATNRYYRVKAER